MSMRCECVCCGSQDCCRAASCPAPPLVDWLTRAAALFQEAMWTTWMCRPLELRGQAQSLHSTCWGPLSFGACLHMGL